MRGIKGKKVPCFQAEAKEVGATVKTSRKAARDNIPEQNTTNSTAGAEDIPEWRSILPLIITQMIEMPVYKNKL